MKCIRLLALTATAGALLAFPAQSMGAFTIGSNLSKSPGLAQGCPGCTFALTVPDAGDALPDGVASPTNGIVTTWRIRRDGGGDAAIAFRVIRPLGGGLFTGAGTTSSVTPPDEAITPYNLPLAISKGDLIGINCCTGATGGFFRILGDSLQFGTFMSPGVLADAGPGRAPDDDEGEVVMQAVIEPTSALANVKTKAKKGGKVRVSLDTPNPGSLVAGDKRDPGVKAFAAAKKPKLLRRIITQTQAPAELTFVVKPTKAAKALLKAGERPKAKLKLVFTPTGGNAGTQVVKVKLKP